MSRSPILNSIVSLLLIGAGGFALLWLGEGEAKQLPETGDQRLAVKVAEVVDHTDGITFDVNGVVVARREIKIAAEVAGRVVFKAENCRPGRTVKTGDVLVKIDDSEYKLEVKRLAEEVAQADANLKEQDVEVETILNKISTAKEELIIRARELARFADIDDPGVFSQTEVDAARRNELAARDALQSQKDKLQLLKTRKARFASAKALANAQKEKAELELSRCELRAPSDGVIISENVEQDGYLQKGSIVVSLQDRTSLEVSCNLHMRQMNWLWQAAPAADPTVDDEFSFPETLVTITYKLNSIEYEWNGKLHRFEGGGIDSQTRMIPCRVNVPEPRKVLRDGKLLSPSGVPRPPVLLTGMFVSVKVNTTPPLRLLRLPDRAVQPGNTVWVVRNGELFPIEVRIAVMRDGMAIVLADESELRAGDEAVTTPLVSPVEGMAVAIQESS
jgi:multidrug efflux pump subunit AcrA (membrane-fusion protein)